MKYDPQYHHRKSNRMKGYDYSLAGVYFITICTNNKECLFGEISNDKMVLNQQGIIANDEWLKTCEMRKNIELDVFVVMPNHIHGIIITTQNDDSCRGVLHTPSNAKQNDDTFVGIFNAPNHINETTINNQGVCNTPLRSPSANIGAIIRGYKSSVTKRINQLNHCNGFAVWQRNYHDHIIRNESSYKNISGYIVNNPANWPDDVLFKE